MEKDQLLQYELSKKIKDTSKRLYNCALQLAKEGDLSGALRLLPSALELDKNNIYARNLLGLLHFEIGEVGQAILNWKKSIVCKPDENQAQNLLRQLSQDTVQLQKMNEALQIYNEALVCYQQKSEDIGIIKLKKAIYKNPKLLQAYNLLALGYIKAGDFDHANKMLQEVLLRDEGNASARHLLRNIKINLPKSKTNRKNAVDLSQTWKNKKWVSKSGILQFTAGFAAAAVLVTFGILPSIKTIRQQQLNNLVAMQKDQIDKLQKQNQQNNIEITQLQKQLETAQNQIPTADSSPLQNNEQPNNNEEVDKQLSEAKSLINGGKLMEADAIIIKLRTAAAPLDQTQEKTLTALRKRLFDRKETLGKKYFDTKEYQKGIDILNSALSDDIEGVRRDKALYNLGKCYVKNEQKDLAKQTFDKLQSEYPKSSYIKYIAGWLNS